MQHHGINFAVLLLGDQPEGKHPTRLRHRGAIGENIVIHGTHDPFRSDGRCSNRENNTSAAVSHSP